MSYREHKANNVKAYTLQWSLVMSYFWQDSDGIWWLKVFGKKRKLRDVTVPNSFIDYLKQNAYSAPS